MLASIDLNGIKSAFGDAEKMVGAEVEVEVEGGM